MNTLREESEKDFLSTLRRVAELGYEGVEFAGFGGLDVKNIKSLLDELGIVTAACHVPLEQLTNNLSHFFDVL
ncbi:hypothetical protein [Litchfieldia alkalitelluris]|uniref:hypothetical protein n=1 Tax=Litchfieldia alkalitelluris TaxID=304268 RepID=UPI00099752A9|nr:hypothetical protein [Litchfieldia alkalitelluris]